MSYILDALRRADAERQQGQVPGLHAATAAFVPTPVPNPRVWAWWSAGAALVAGAALLGAWWWQAPAPSGPPRPQAPTAAETRPQGPAVAPAAAPAVAPAVAPVVAPVVAPAVAATVAPTPPALPIVVSAVPVAPAPGPAPAPAPAAAPVAIPVDTPAVPSAPKPVPLPSLSADQRRELPRLVVGGSVWSDNAANRFVILDGQMLREGDAVVSGLVLERILPKSAVLRWRDMRLELAL